ncbi:uncharacterized protein PV09_01608 [Verruconis gallopava]|uniref:Uncharacterized protein n=1 Tax=Verruconis gallopava TaxID=253628 RepID=A0A0D2ALM2_9PEZI|nr:uncharacterized protein PV09_01608 [Verruconis gallopava]KIW07668.1 hypothetical protein PV09_01608 [Verruconis gallopava]
MVASRDDRSQTRGYYVLRQSQKTLHFTARLSRPPCSQSRTRSTACFYGDGGCKPQAVPLIARLTPRHRSSYSACRLVYISRDNDRSLATRRVGRSLAQADDCQKQLRTP